jgi:hypothetical protein
MPLTSRPCRHPTAHNTLLNASKPLPFLDDDSIKLHATSKEGTRTHSPEGDWVAILPIFGKLFLEMVKAICKNFGITQKRFRLFNEFNLGRGKQLSTCVRRKHSQATKYSVLLKPTDGTSGTGRTVLAQTTQNSSTRNKHPIQND